MNDRRSTETIRRFVTEIADDINHGEIGAWAQELKAWQALNEGDYSRTAIEARAGVELAPHSPVAVQLLGHEAEALARLGDSEAARRSLDDMNERRTAMRPVDVPRHHFQLEARKFDKVDMRVLQLLGDHNGAAEIANMLLARIRQPDGQWRQPMLASKALAALAVQAAAGHDVDEALVRLNQALDVERQSLPSLISSVADVFAALEPVGDRSDLEDIRFRFDELRRV